MTGRKDLTVDDGTCLFCPSFTIRILATGVHYKVYIPTERILFPRIHKFQFIWCHILASGFKIIFHIAIIVSTQTTDSFLDKMKALSVITTTCIPFQLLAVFSCISSDCDLQILLYALCKLCMRSCSSAEVLLLWNVSWHNLETKFNQNTHLLHKIQNLNSKNSCNAKG